MIVWHIVTKRGILLLLLKIYRKIKLPYFTLSYLLLVYNRLLLNETKAACTFAPIWLEVRLLGLHSVHTQAIRVTANPISQFFLDHTQTHV